MRLTIALRLFALIIVAALFAGCVSPTTTWNKRIGHYTYDQAIIDLGPPDKAAKLSDGRHVAEWISRYSNGSGTAIVSGFGPYPGGVGIVQTVGPQYYESKLRLTFGTNNILSEWNKN
jgi:hypothetical protein